MRGREYREPAAPDPDEDGVAATDFFDYDVEDSTKEVDKGKLLGELIAYGFTGLFLLLCATGTLWLMARAIKDIFFS
jgi:hypothetical protein